MGAVAQLPEWLQRSPLSISSALLVWTARRSESVKQAQRFSRGPRPVCAAPTYADPLMLGVKEEGAVKEVSERAMDRRRPPSETLWRVDSTMNCGA